MKKALVDKKLIDHGERFNQMGVANQAIIFFGDAREILPKLKKQGNSTSGWKKWKTKNNKTLEEIFKNQ